QRTAVKAGDEKPSDSAPAEAQAPASLTDEQWNKVADFDAAAAYKGNKDAKVVMVEFTDYECPFCARYFSDSYKSIVEKYVDTNKIAYINRDLPLSFHKSAESAALAARCAGDQGKYYEMHDLLFENQTEWTTGDARDAFVKYAGDLGLNTAEFESCYDNGKFVEEIKADAALASSVGANGTPTFFINGEKLVGAQPIATFEQAIEAALGN
ncbi:MAG: thioredoxin, partial [Phototrophicales bacterium]